MPEDKVAIIKKNGFFEYYPTYAAARAQANLNAGDHDLIQIRADLPDEQIILKNKTDIWILDGVKINNSFGYTISDNNQPVICTIYGNGIIENNRAIEPYFECIKTSHPDTELRVECDRISGIGGTIAFFIGSSVSINNARKFQLSCNKVSSKNNTAIYIGTTSSIEIQDININVQIVEVTNSSNSPQAIAIATSGNGFIRVNEIKCNHFGHCLMHRRGSIIAFIKKMTTINNIVKADATVVIGHGTGTQKLVLYFDEVLALGAGAVTSGPGINLDQGTGILIGGRVYSKSDRAIQISGPSTMGFVKCDEIISEFNLAMELNNFTNQITIIANNITGNAGGENGAIYSLDSATFFIKNARIKNLSTSLDCRGISLNNFGGLPNVTLQNVKIVTQNVSNPEIIYVNGASPVTVKNYGLFANKDKPSYVTFSIANLGNFLFTHSPDLS